MDPVTTPVVPSTTPKTETAQLTKVVDGFAVKSIGPAYTNPMGKVSYPVNCEKGTFKITAWVDASKKVPVEGEIVSIRKSILNVGTPEEKEFYNISSAFEQTANTKSLFGI